MQQTARTRCTRSGPGTRSNRCRARHAERASSRTWTPRTSMNVRSRRSWTTSAVRRAAARAQNRLLPTWRQRYFTAALGAELADAAAAPAPDPRRTRHTQRHAEPRRLPARPACRRDAAQAPRDDDRCRLSLGSSPEWRSSVLPQADVFSLPPVGIGSPQRVAVAQRRQSRETSSPTTVGESALRNNRRGRPPSIGATQMSDVARPPATPGAP